MNFKVSLVAFFIMMTLFVPFVRAYTVEQDVYAINAFYTALGSPLLPGWVSTGGDPCAEGWQGVQCINGNIMGIVLNGANLGGQLGDALGNFTSILTIDLSNNNIGGIIPENLPTTMQSLFLSANQFTGSLPNSLSKLTLLTAMSVNNNHLTGDLPDAFQSLASLVNLDLSFNNISGDLPPSVGGLSSLTTLHAQNNQLSGTLNILENLPLKDLNIEDNRFAGPIPEKLFNIPNFRKDGNPFNTTISPSLAPLSAPAAPMQKAPPSPMTPPSSMTPSTPLRVPLSGVTLSNSSNAPSDQSNSSAEKKQNMSTMKIVGYVLLAVVIFSIVVLIVIFCFSKCREREIRDYESFERQIGRTDSGFKEPIVKEPPVNPKYNLRNDAKENYETRKKGHALGVTMTDRKITSKQEKEHAIDVRHRDDVWVTPLSPPLLPPPPPLPRPEKIVVNPILPRGNDSRSLKSSNNRPPRNLSPTSVASFSVASLQQYTNSFSEENLMREEVLGKVYLAELSDGKLLEVMKIDNVNSRLQIDDFLEMVIKLSELKHPNILELVGYCAEHGQLLLVYKHFSSRTLYDILYCTDDLNVKISWDARVRIALGTAKALEYLHEGCQPPIVYQHFESGNIHVDDDFDACVSECGLYSLMLSNSISQLSGRMRAMYSYEAPEISHNGSYTEKSDVYSFGIVMLELLTGRRPYESSRPRLEQHLVVWASSKLHDINALRRMVDPAIAGNYSEKSLSCFADIISRCIQQGPEFRPLMSEVVHDLTRMLRDIHDTKKRDLI